MIHSQAIQEQFGQVMDDVLPSQDNAQIVVRSGGADNAYGEKIGQAESLVGIKIFSQGEARESRTSNAGDTRPIAINFVAKSSVPIDEGARIRWDGNDYNVEFSEKVVVGDHQVYWDGRMRKIQGN